MILQAEQRLTARQEALGLRMREAAAPRRLLAPAAAGGLALLALWWLLRRRGAAAGGAGPATLAPGHTSPQPLAWAQQLGLAWPLPGGRGAGLERSLWPAWLRRLPGAWTPYWVLQLDEDAGLALLGSPDRRHLWLLARQPQPSPAQVQPLLENARAQRFKLARLQFFNPR